MDCQLLRFYMYAMRWLGRSIHYLKVLWNSILSTEITKFMGLNISNVCFWNTKGLVRVNENSFLYLFQQHTIDKYDLQSLARNGHLCLEIWLAIYGLPLVGARTNVKLWNVLAPAGYYELAHTQGLWWHGTRPIQFTLVADNFWVKHFDNDYVEHLINTI